MTNNRHNEVKLTGLTAAQVGRIDDYISCMETSSDPAIIAVVEGCYVGKTVARMSLEMAYDCCDWIRSSEDDAVELACGDCIGTNERTFAERQARKSVQLTVAKLERAIEYADNDKREALAKEEREREQQRDFDAKKLALREQAERASNLPDPAAKRRRPAAAIITKHNLTKPYDRALAAQDARLAAVAKALASMERTSDRSGYYTEILRENCLVERKGNNWQVQTDGGYGDVVASRRTRRAAIQTAVLRLLTALYEEDDAAEQWHCEECGDLINSASEGCTNEQCGV